MLTRTRLFFIAIALCFSVLVVRLFYWQVIKGKELSEEARGQYQRGFTVGATRGDILANDESWLAGSSPAWLLYAEVSKLENTHQEIADKLGPLLVESTERKDLLVEIDRLKSILAKKDVVWVPLKNKVDSKTKALIEELGIEGLGFEQIESRVYPEASAAAHLLGFVGKNKDGEDEGYFGLEGFYNLPLSGKPGFVTRENDARGVPILFGNSKEVSAIGGVDLITHIDKTIQLSLETKLKEGIEKYGASGGTAIVMNPEDGAILGMSSYPSYDPKAYSDFGDALFTNPAISASFEPGSIFKVLVMASGLDAGVIRPETKCDVCSGPLPVNNYFISTWDDKYYPDSTMTDVLVNSDNVGMAFIGQKLGSERLYDYLSAFGIGEVTGVDLQGEFSPSLREKGTWSVVDLATASFGQGVAVTPIQMVKAVGIIANGGIGVNPQVVDKLKGDDWSEDIKSEVGERVISDKAAKEVTAMMVEAAKKGEAKWTYMTGFKVAGKTGTAQIPIAGYYDAERTIASFVGFAPYDNPKFIMLVTLKEPKTSQWASETAAPLWYTIAKDLFSYFGMQPEN